MNQIQKRIKAFGYAFNGLYLSLKEDVPMRIHVLATIIVCALAAYFKVSRVEWIFLLLACTLVMGAELVNSAIERMCDVLHPEKSKQIKFIKDVSAGAVLVFTLFAIITGGMIFYPYLLTLITK